jgi:hypothetical protein
MLDPMPHATPKIHPATREILLDDPLELQACEVPGDPQLMLRLLVEEFARIGWDTAAIMQLACDPNYQAFHGLLRLYGPNEMRQQVSQIISRCGVMRVTRQEKPLDPPPDQLVQVDLPT